MTNAQAHRLRVEPVQAVTEEAIQALYADGDPWPGVHLDEAWLGECVRHGNHFVECREWAAYANTDEVGQRHVHLCHAYVSAQADPYSDYVSWEIPAALACEEIPA